jgi:HK97 family phage prohead protease
MGVDYQEEWMPGVFSHQLNAAHRVVANFEHQPGIGGIVGHGLALREAADGFHGSFKIHDTPAGETALILLREKVAELVSLEARPKKNTRSVGGVIQRVKADLLAIAFTRFGAYSGARVLALRDQATTLDEELLPVAMDPDLVERCRRLGLSLPQRYEAHPAETDTPPDGGTSGDGTRPAESESTSEG